MRVSLTLLAANFYAKSERPDGKGCKTYLGQTTSIESFILLLGRGVLTETKSGSENGRGW
jgi:hypothetical protein